MIKTEQLAKLFPQQGGSIVDYLNSLGIDSSRTNRAKLAQQYGIEGYKGIAEQNMKLLSLMRKDKSKKEPVQQKQNKPAQQTTSKPKNPQVPSFDEWLYVTGASQTGGNVYDEIETVVGSALGATTQSGEGAMRQALAQMINPVVLKDGKGKKYTAVHYDAAKRYFPEYSGVGSDLMSNSVSNLPVFVSNYTIGQNNETTRDKYEQGGEGWYKTDDGGYKLRDTTDYHMFTYVDPKTGKKVNVSEESNPELYKKLTQGSVWQDVFSGIYNPMTLLENAGTRNKWKGTREIHITPEEVQNYSDQYESVINDPKKLEAYYNLKGSLTGAKPTVSTKEQQYTGTRGGAYIPGAHTK